MSSHETLMKLRKARSQLIHNHPFYGTLAMYLILTERSNQSDGAAFSTNGKNLFYKSHFVEECTMNELIGCIAHEVMHCCLQHHIRRKHRDIKQWNIACDYAINPILISAGFVLPKDVLIEPTFTGMSAEEIYARLASPAKPHNQTCSNTTLGGANTTIGGAAVSHSGGLQGGQSPRGASGVAAKAAKPALPGSNQGFRAVKAPAWGAFTDAAPPKGAESPPQAELWGERVTHALAVAARAAGGLSADLKAIAESNKRPTVNWQEQLQTFIRDKARTDHSWVKPNKRMLNQGFILPGTTPMGLEKIGICVDTSGSINEKLFKQFLSEIESAMDAVNAQEVIIVQCDAKVKRVNRFDQDEPIVVEIVGRGGTKFSPALAWFEEHEPDIAVLIYFTDLESNDYGQEPPMPVLWAAYGYESRLNVLAEKVPFGSVIKIIE